MRLKETDDFIAINLIQHFIFCKRQWALMVLEDRWAENIDTIKGNDIHDKAHNISFTEKRGDRLITRGLPIISYELGIIGKTDVVEYHKNEQGIELKNYEGKYIPYSIEYKKGKPKKGSEDIMQLVAQVMCLEEMHGITILESAIYYKQTNKRFVIEITKELRDKLKSLLKDMKSLQEISTTPKAEKNRNCKRCSLIEYCWPRLTTHKRSVSNYIKEHVEVLI